MSSRTETATPFHVAVSMPSELGECPIWSTREQALYWIDIVKPALHRLEAVNGEVTTIDLPEEIGCVAFTPEGFVAAFRSGIYLLDRAGQRLKLLAANPENTETARFNDGRVDRRGRLWVGTLSQSGEPQAHLYCLTGTTLETIDGGLTISNGMAFSPDSQFAYHSDTPRRVIYRHAINVKTGAIGPREEWVRMAPGSSDGSGPDGAAIDAEGCYWVALYGEGKIQRYRPTGAPDVSFPVPALCPTMVCFGGPTLKTIYVTSARHNRPADELARWPHSGCVFAMQTDVPGVMEHEFVNSSDRNGSTQ